MVDTPAGATSNAMVKSAVIATVLQLAMVVIGHFVPAVSQQFAVGGTAISAIGGLLFSRFGGGTSLGQAAAGGALAGGGSAFIGIVASYFLKDFPASTIGIGTGASTIAGVVGGLIGKFVGGTKSAA